MDALRRDGRIEFIHVRNEEYGVFAAVAEAYLTGNPVAVCGTAGPGVVHLLMDWMDARKEGAPIIAIAGDTETTVLDTFTLEELNPYKFFDAASLYTARVVDPSRLVPYSILQFLPRSWRRAHGDISTWEHRVCGCGSQLDRDNGPGHTTHAPCG